MISNYLSMIVVKVHIKTLISIKPVPYTADKITVLVLASKKRQIFNLLELSESIIRKNSKNDCNGGPYRNNK